jgi:hypothetical protein
VYIHIVEVNASLVSIHLYIYMCTHNLLIWASAADAGRPQQWHQWMAVCLDSQLANFSSGLILALFLDHIKQ